MQEWEEVRKELLKDPAVKREYEKLRPEYELARELIKARLSKKLTQEQLANKVGVKQAYIARLEGGDANPTVGNLNRIANVLGKRLKLVGNPR
jgi:DNA-binding XRE family transcriptional regulator